MNTLIAITNGQLNIGFIVAVAIAILTIGFFYVATQRYMAGRITVTHTNNWKTKNTQVKVWKAGINRKPVLGYSIKNITSR